MWGWPRGSCVVPTWFAMVWSGKGLDKKELRKRARAALQEQRRFRVTFP